MPICGAFLYDDLINLPATKAKDPANRDSTATRSRADSIAFHDGIAEEWDRKYSKASFRSRQLTFEKCLPPRLLGRWLDAGCGTGILSRWLADKGVEVECVDLAPKMLERFACHRGSCDGNDRLKEPRLADVNLLPFPGGFFEGILCSSVLEYVDDPQSALHELRRVLTAGGWLAISVPNRASVFRRALEAAFRVTSTLGKPWPAYIEFSKHRFTVSEFRELLRSTGFEPKQFAGCGISLPGLKNTHLGWSLLVFGAIKKP